MISAEQIKLMTKMSDPKQLAKLKENGVPTIDPAKIKELAQKQQEANAASMASSMTSAIGSLQASADKEIQNRIEEMEKLGKVANKIPNGVPSSISGSGGQAANALQMEIEKLKQAKEHGMSSGNFVPLMAILNPSVNLKHLSKDTVVLPKIELPKVPEVPKIPGTGGTV